MTTPVLTACSHVWINPSDPWNMRAPYSPVIGSKRHEMHPDTLYECLHCGGLLRTPREDGDNGSAD